MNLKIVCKENFKYEVQEKSPANQAVTMQQLAEEYWRWILPSVPEKHAHANGIFWFLKNFKSDFAEFDSAVAFSFNFCLLRRLSFFPLNFAENDF